MKWTEQTVLDALRDTYLPATSALQTEEWAFLTQVLLRSTNEFGRTNERKIDALVVRNWGSGKHGHERIAIEVKVSAADYRSENPQKRAPAEASAHRCAYAAPTGLIDPATLPDGWGLIEVAAVQHPWMTEPTFETTWTRRATRREPTADLDYLVSAGFRRASRAEERIRRGDCDATELAALRERVKALEGIAERATEARDREIARAKAARNEVLALVGGNPSCSTCGHPITWKRGGHQDSVWVHKNPEHDHPCQQARYADWAEVPTAFRSYRPAPVEPAALAG